MLDLGLFKPNNVLILQIDTVSFIAQPLAASEGDRNGRTDYCFFNLMNYLSDISAPFLYVIVNTEITMIT
jgi:hypothetical protein